MLIISRLYFIPKYKKNQNSSCFEKQNKTSAKKISALRLEHLPKLISFLKHSRTEMMEYHMTAHLSTLPQYLLLPTRMKCKPKDLCKKPKLTE